MRSTMGDDQPLTVTAILRHGATWHADREVVTLVDKGTSERVSPSASPTRGGANVPASS